MKRLHMVTKTSCVVALLCHFPRRPNRQPAKEGGRLQALLCLLECLRQMIRRGQGACQSCPVSPCKMLDISVSLLLFLFSAFNAALGLQSFWPR